MGIKFLEKLMHGDLVYYFLHSGFYIFAVPCNIPNRNRQNAVVL